MKDRINTKVAEIVEYILRKPVETVTHEDYAILIDELRKAQAAEGGDGLRLMWPMLMMLLSTIPGAK